ncbi:uncharacterized protein LOC142317505 [Lycorma delicatula]|uniref:uncharacterized protein LOC142317505 n=1 Tax=Lycorma delicatula TaxID=130591 RepID=UPI003F516145
MANRPVEGLRTSKRNILSQVVIMKALYEAPVWLVKLQRGRPRAILSRMHRTVYAVVVPSLALRCYQCGQYNDGVGSITPCINYTARLHLKECPDKLSQHCIKYVSEGSTVRDCAGECVEKGESWGTKVYCCREDGCNAGYSLRVEHSSALLLIVVTLLALRVSRELVTSLHLY